MMTQTKPRKQSSKAKEVENTKLNIIGWNTTDTDEIERRRLRGRLEKYQIQNLELQHTHFSTFILRSRARNSHHTVEIRSLTDLINSCNCPDYGNNGLGTCKHIEHLLFHLKKSGKNRFKQASLKGVPA